MNDEKNGLPLDENSDLTNGDEANNNGETEETAENQEKSPFHLNIEDLDENTIIEDLDENTIKEDKNNPLITSQETNEAVTVKKTKTKKKRGCLVGAIYASCIVVISIFIALFILYTINDMSGITKPDVVVGVEIPKGAKTSQIADILHKNGVIDIPLVFRLYSKMTKADGKYQYGPHNLNKNMGYSEIIRVLESTPLDPKDQISVTFPEGFTVEQIAAKLEENNVCDRASFITASKEDVLNYDFIKTLPKNPNRIRKLEGYLFPDTYKFFIGEAADSVVKKFLDNFKKHISTQMLADMNAQGLTYDKMLTIASIVQTEGLNSDVMPDVASVFYNRLNNPNQYPYLQSDATVLYVMLTRKVWLNNDDISNKSPYNTYNHKGLPPGPICNPGIDAINATIHPSTTQYYFFVTDSDNIYYFSKTLAEHEKNVSRIKSSGKGALGTNVAE
jgi:UPF0755 protein